MKLFRKTYEGPGTDGYTMGLYVDKVHTPIVFNEGTTYPIPKKNQYVTSNIKIQEAIEKTSQFKCGKVSIYAQVALAQDEKPDPLPENKDNPVVEAPVVEAPKVEVPKVEAPIVEAPITSADDGFTPKYARNQAFTTVKNSQDVADKLAEKLGMEPSTLEDPTANLLIAKKNNMVFPNLQ